jgi:MipA family protein
MKADSVKSWLLAAVALAAVSIAVQQARAYEFLIPLELSQPNFFGLGVGSYPDYIGSDDTAVGVAPIGQFSFGGHRFVRLLVNDLRVNLLDDPNWRFGPVGLWRFGRDDDVDDKVVRKMHEIDSSFSLGLFGTYVWRDSRDPRKQAGVGGWALGDVTGVYNGWNAGLNAFAMQPVAKMVTLGGGAAFTYGSSNYMDEYFGVTARDALATGLPVYQAGAGVRDVRGWVSALLHLSPQWHLGAGVMYSRLVGDAADSPIVTERGSENQWIYGVGALYAW